MATGFASIQRNAVNKKPGYKTLFEKVTEATEGEKKSLTWYKSTVQQISKSYTKDLSKFNKDERADKLQDDEQQDENILRTYPREGHLYLFRYKAKMRWLPYYDKHPLVYVIKANGIEFWGANLHYLPPKKRIIAAKRLMEGVIDVPKACLHKYIEDHVEGLYLDLASAEWDTAVLLPVEEFVKTVKNHDFPYKKEDVWDEMKDSYYDKFKGHRTIKGYGKKSDITMAK